MVSVKVSLICKFGKFESFFVKLSNRDGGSIYPIKKTVLYRITQKRFLLFIISLLKYHNFNCTLALNFSRKRNRNIHHRKNWGEDSRKKRVSFRELIECHGQLKFHQNLTDSPELFKLASCHATVQRHAELLSRF